MKWQEAWKKLHDEELHNLYFSPTCNENDHVKEDGVGRVCSTNGKERNACCLLVGKSEGKRQRRSRRR
jgi:hypothetical protein